MDLQRFSSKTLKTIKISFVFYLNMYFTTYNIFHYTNVGKYHIKAIFDQKSLFNSKIR